MADSPAKNTRRKQLLKSGAHGSAIRSRSSNPQSTERRHNSSPSPSDKTKSKSASPNNRFITKLEANITKKPPSGKKNKSVGDITPFLVINRDAVFNSKKGVKDQDGVIVSEVQGGVNCMNLHEVASQTTLGKHSTLKHTAKEN